LIANNLLTTSLCYRYTTQLKAEQPMASSLRSM
jgi:hypothetical protein